MKKAPDLRFHGVSIPPLDYAQVRRLATVFYGEVDVRVDDERAWHTATRFAVKVLAMWRGAPLGATDAMGDGKETER